MPQTRITDYFRPVNDPGPSSPAPAPASARAPRPARNGPVAPELQARAPRPYATQTLNRDHARVDLGTKFAAFSERMRRDQTPPAPAYVLSHTSQPAPAAGPSTSTPPQPQYVLSHMTQPAPAATPAPATPQQPLYVLSHMTQPAPAPTAEPAPAAPPQPQPQPQYVLSHMTQPAPDTRAEPSNGASHTAQPAATAEPAPATPPAPQFVLNHMSQAHALQQPLYYLNHNPQPVYDDPFGRHNRHQYFAGRMTNLLTGLSNRLLPRRRRNGDA